MVGWYSETSAQTLVTDLFTREIPEGSPPSSSKIIKRFCVGFNQDLGTWYLMGEILLGLMKKFPQLGIQCYVYNRPVLQNLSQIS